MPGCTVRASTEGRPSIDLARTERTLRGSVSSANGSSAPGTTTDRSDATAEASARLEVSSPPHSSGRGAPTARTPSSSPNRGRTPCRLPCYPWERARSAHAGRSARQPSGTSLAWAGRRWGNAVRSHPLPPSDRQRRRRRRLGDAALRESILAGCSPDQHGEHDAAVGTWRAYFFRSAKTPRPTSNPTGRACSSSLSARIGLSSVNACASDAT